MNMAKAVLLSLAGVLLVTQALPTPSTIIPEFVEESTQDWLCPGYAKAWNNKKSEFEAHTEAFAKENGWGATKLPKHTFLRVRITSGIESSLKAVDKACERGQEWKMMDKVYKFKCKVQNYVGEKGALGQALANPATKHQQQLRELEEFLTLLGQQMYQKAEEIQNSKKALPADNPMYHALTDEELKRQEQWSSRDHEDHYESDPAHKDRTSSRKYETLDGHGGGVRRDTADSLTSSQRTYESIGSETIGSGPTASAGVEGGHDSSLEDSTGSYDGDYAARAAALMRERFPYLAGGHFGGPSSCLRATSFNSDSDESDDEWDGEPETTR